MDVANEFILANASMSTAGSATAVISGTTSAAQGLQRQPGPAYELTGQNERQAEQYVGRRAEVSGKLKSAETTAAGPTGGPSAAAPPRGVDIASQDLKLGELEVTTVRATTGTCPTQ